MVKGLILGIAIGVGVGWLLFAGSATPVRSETRPQATPEKPAPEPPLPVPAAATIPPRKDLAPIRARIEQARAERDWNAFRAAVGRLDGSDPEAAALLVELMSDRRLSFHQGLGREFEEALRDADVSGIGDGALFRLKDCLEQGRVHDYHHWAALVARHGDARVVGELVAMARTCPEDHRYRILRPLACAAGRSEVAAQLELLYASASGELRDDLDYRLWDVAASNPALGYRLARERFDTVGYESVQPVANALWLAATPQQREEVKALLLATEDELKLFHALDGLLWDVEVDQYRGLEPAFDRVLARIERPDRGSVFDLALEVVLENRVLWSPRALAAIEAHAPSVAPSDQGDFEERVEAIREHLGQPKHRWDPDR